MKTVTIYSTAICKYCALAKDFFKEHNVEFTEKRVGRTTEQEAINLKEMVDKSEQMGVPVITVDNEVIVGFDEERLNELLVVKA